LCGIVGYIGSKKASEILMDGLHRLEYRGYDSAGLAVIGEEGTLQVRKVVGKLKEMDASLEKEPLLGRIGLGHTRWATHGVPSEKNSHPHLSCDGKIAVVHNGIIENYQTLRQELQKQGHEFKSDTDTETAAHLIEKNFKGNLEEAVRASLKEIEGSYAFGIVSEKDPEKLVAARKDSPLIIGVGEGENFIASDVPAILKYTKRVIYLDNLEYAVLTKEGVKVFDLNGKELQKEIKEIEWSAEAAEKGGFPHFMLKEINEQPRAIKETIMGRVKDGKVDLAEEVGLREEELKGIEKIMIVSCGTAWHAGLVGKYLIEEFVKLPVEVDIASEYRYRKPLIDSKTIFMAITQSGETADTLAALRLAKEKGAKVVSIVNAVGSSIARESDGVIYTHAGPEIGVASTKAYTTQITALVLFTIYLGKLKGTISEEQEKKMLAELQEVPEKIEKMLKNEGFNKALEECKESYSKATDFLFLGRSYDFPTALEGALKLKEISYIHAEGYGAGEMKHGPIALVDEKLPVVCIATASEVYDKMVSNIQEIKARKGIVISIATEGDEKIKQHSDKVVFVPRVQEYLAPLVNAVPMQLLSYHIAVKRGCDVDQPRNLAKSVTVE